MTNLISDNKVFPKYNDLTDKDIKHIESQYEDHWGHISENYVLSEDFIKLHQNEVDWECISNSQELSEEFIIEFQDKVDWYWISNSQELSIKFISLFYNKIWFNCVVYNDKISDEVKEFCKIFI